MARKREVFRVGDPVTWKDLNGDEPVVRTGRVLAELSEQYLLEDTLGVVRFVFKTDASLCMYKENN